MPSDLLRAETNPKQVDTDGGKEQALKAVVDQWANFKTKFWSCQSLARKAGQRLRTHRHLVHQKEVAGMMRPAATKWRKTS